MRRNSSRKKDEPFCFLQLRLRHSRRRIRQCVRLGFSLGSNACNYDDETSVNGASKWIKTIHQFSLNKCWHMLILDHHHKGKPMQDCAPVTRGWQDQDQSVNCKPSFLLTLITLKTQSYCAGKRWTKHENVLAIKHHVNCNSIESKSFTQLNKHNAKRQKISDYAWSLVADFVTLFFDVFVWAFMWSSHFSFTLNQWAPFLWNLSWSHWCLNK